MACSAAGRAGLARLGRRRVLLNTRGLTELIALNVALAGGIIDGRLYTVLVVMALVTTALTAPLLSALGFPGRVQAGKPTALTETHARTDHRTLPEQDETTMPTTAMNTVVMKFGGTSSRRPWTAARRRPAHP